MSYYLGLVTLTVIAKIFVVSHEDGPWFGPIRYLKIFAGSGSVRFKYPGVSSPRPTGFGPLVPGRNNLVVLDTQSFRVTLIQ